MKRGLVFILISAMLLVGCGGANDEGTESVPVQEVQNETTNTQNDVDTEAVVEETETVEDTEVVPEKEEEETPEAQTNQSASNGGGTQSGSWSDGYEMYVWYDMGEYFFMRVANVDEARQYLNQFPSTHWQTLKDRYPDREIVYGGTGPNCAVVSAVYMDPETGFPIWSADYLWD